MIKFLNIESVNFQDWPSGGTLSFSKQLLHQFRGEVALVGLITDKKDPVGKWFEKEINGTIYNYFGIGRFKKSDKKPIIPLRIKSWFYLLIYLSRIRAINVGNIFTQSPHLLFALNLYKWNSLCFCFAGISNSVSNSRYRILRFLGTTYEKRLFRILKNNADVILAASDRSAIKDAITRTGKILEENVIHSFPTRFDPKVFYPLDKYQCRKKLQIDESTILLLTTGRLSWVKGWQLLIDVVQELYNSKFKNIKLIFVGEGEDKSNIENYNSFLLSNKIIELTGKIRQEDLPIYLCAADIVVFGSFFEGWPTSMVEAMACGCTIVTTNVSGASEIVYDGKNGYIVKERNPKVFALYIEKALKLENVKKYSLTCSDKFSVEYLKADLVKLWLSKI